LPLALVGHEKSKGQDLVWPLHQEHSVFGYAMRANFSRRMSGSFGTVENSFNKGSRAVLQDLLTLRPAATLFTDENKLRPA